MTMTTLDAAAVAAIDSTGQLGEVLGLSEHLSDGLWRVDSAGLRAADAPGGLVVAGMGGSAVGYATVVALEAARLCGAAPDLRREVEAAAARVAREAEAWGPDGPDDAAP